MAEVLKIYDEITGKELDTATVDKNVADGLGYVYQGQRKTGTIPEHFEVMEGTTNLRRYVPEQIIYEDCKLYHAFTEEELAPTWQETMEAQISYTALMTNTILDTGAPAGEHSAMFTKIARWYKLGLWDKTCVHNVVSKNAITPAEYQEITGEPYTA